MSVCKVHDTMNTQFVLHGFEDEFDLPKHSFGKIIFDILKKRNFEDVLNVDAVTNKTLTCGRLLEESMKLAKALRNFGLEKGDVIAIISENTINYVIPLLAALYIGVAVNTINPAYTSGELKHALLISKAKIIFFSGTAVETVLKIKTELDFIEMVYLTESQPANQFNANTLEDLLETYSANTDGFELQDFDYTKELAFIVSSSGTSGVPKGVMLTHENLRIPISLFLNPHYMNVTSSDATVVVVPFFHIYGCLLQIATLISSMKSIIVDKFRPEIYLKFIQEHKATKLFIVPALLQFLVKNPLVDFYDISSIQEIYLGTAPLGKELQNEATKKLENTAVRQMYGLTETAGPCTLQMNLNKNGSVGCLAPGATAKICDPDTKEILGPFKTGEICLKGPMVMQGYLPTQNCFDEDGFFRTGDLGFYDQDGYFYLVDRIKEFIKYKGFQVAPAELEALIITHPMVKDCGVIGVPDERAGEVPLAFVVLKGDSVNAQDIVDFVAERISVQKRLYGGVKFIEEIPRNPTGKILRRKLVEMATKLK